MVHREAYDVLYVVVCRHQLVQARNSAPVHLLRIFPGHSRVQYYSHKYQASSVVPRSWLRYNWCVANPA